ncbi:uncharacterized protein CDAR_275911 [Caerostris darwini]|uniref:TIL domain-containing protein n=1 Tax=Caerostris darwini TaxID=1538125 RepID=A0AAV4RM84_9ARAC|nr:uncharacterized protein CDAR_275911 [Caerostris darwini]
MKFVLVVVALMLFEETNAQANCGPNQMPVEQDRCVRRCDIPTCSNPYPDPSQPCTADCFDGCLCKDGYIKRDGTDGVCVRQCPKRNRDPQTNCGPNEQPVEPDRCVKACSIPTCSNPNPDPSQPCTGNCYSGCLCKDGYIRDDMSGYCVRPEKCQNDPQNTCGPNEQPVEPDRCVKACSIPTCSNPNPDPSQPCTGNCYSGCLCKDGYVRDDMSGNCVRPKNCQNDPQNNCGRNEQPVEPGRCVKACSIPTCSNPNPDPSQPCTGNCYSGCLCKDGYVRDDMRGNCVRPKNCPNGRREARLLQSQPKSCKNKSQ